MSAELASAALHADSHLLLEQPLLKVPYEVARKNHKSAQRNIERERDQLLASLKSAAQEACTAGEFQHNGNGHAPGQSALESLDGMIKRVETLKRKLETLKTEEESVTRATKARITHLSELHKIPSTADVKFDEWSKIRLNRLLVDYLLRQGYDSSAKAYAKQTGIEQLVDIEAFVQCSRIERSLRERGTQDALAWCAENKAHLKKTNNVLEFQLRLQQYIELVRTRETAKLLEARIHARKYLAAHWDTLDAIQAAGLLAFAPDSDLDDYQAKLYSPARWSYLADLFVRTHHSLLSLPADPSLYFALSAGLSALKTPSCHSIHAASSGNVSTSTSGTSVCPICSTELNELARNVPYANHAQSSIEPDPVVLPNLRIYGRDRLIRLNEKLMGAPSFGSESTVRDPMDPMQVFRWEDVKKVFIM